MTGQIPSKSRRSSGLQLQKQHSSPSVAFRKQDCSATSGHETVLLVYGFQTEENVEKIDVCTFQCLSVVHRINVRLLFFFSFFLSCVSICFHSGFLSVTLRPRSRQEPKHTQQLLQQFGLNAFLNLVYFLLLFCLKMSSTNVNVIKLEL